MNDQQGGDNDAGDDRYDSGKEFLAEIRPFPVTRKGMQSGDAGHAVVRVMPRKLADDGAFPVVERQVGAARGGGVLWGVGAGVWAGACRRVWFDSADVARAALLVLSGSRGVPCAVSGSWSNDWSDVMLAPFRGLSTWPAAAPIRCCRRAHCVRVAWCALLMCMVWCVFVPRCECAVAANAVKYTPNRRGYEPINSCRL